MTNNNSDLHLAAFVLAGQHIVATLLTTLALDCTNQAGKTKTVEDYALAALASTTVAEMQVHLYQDHIDPQAREMLPVFRFEHADWVKTVDRFNSMLTEYLDSHNMPYPQKAALRGLIDHLIHDSEPLHPQEDNE